MAAASRRSRRPCGGRAAGRSSSRISPRASPRENPAGGGDLRAQRASARPCGGVSRPRPAPRPRRPRRTPRMGRRDGRRGAGRAPRRYRHEPARPAGRGGAGAGRRSPDRAGRDRPRDEPSRQRGAAGRPAQRRPSRSLRPGAGRLPPLRASLANSSGTCLAARARHDLLRPGYALFGGNPEPGQRNPMRPVVRLEATILQLRAVEAGESCGYNGRWQAPPRAGWPRSRSATPTAIPAPPATAATPWSAACPARSSA